MPDWNLTRGGSTGHECKETIGWKDGERKITSKTTQGKSYKQPWDNPLTHVDFEENNRKIQKGAREMLSTLVRGFEELFLWWVRGSLVRTWHRAYIYSPNGSTWFFSLLLLKMLSVFVSPCVFTVFMPGYIPSRQEHFHHQVFKKITIELGTLFTIISIMQNNQKQF